MHTTEHTLGSTALIVCRINRKQLIKLKISSGLISLEVIPGQVIKLVQLKFVKFNKEKLQVNKKFISSYILVIFESNNFFYKNLLNVV